MMKHFAKSLVRPVLSRPSLLTRSMPLARPSLSLVRQFTVPSFQLPQSVVVLEYEYAPRLLETREPFHEGHLFLAKEMIAQGTCIAGGPIAPHSVWNYDGEGAEEPTGAFFWFTSPEAAEEFLLKDPYANIPNMVTGYKIYDWKVAVSNASSI